MAKIKLGKIRLCLICLGLSGGLTGCGSHPAVNTSGVQTAASSDSQRQGQAAVERQFLETLQALQADQRPAYVQMHQDVARMVMSDPDPKISGSLQRLMPMKK